MIASKPSSTVFLALEGGPLELGFVSNWLIAVIE